MEKSGFENLPQHVYDALARMILPMIQEFYSADDGQKLFEEWKQNQEHENNDGAVESK